MNDQIQREVFLAASIHEIKNRFGSLFCQLDGLLDQLQLNSQQVQTANHLISDAEFIGDELVRILVTYRNLGDASSPATGNAADLISRCERPVFDYLEEQLARHSAMIRARDLRTDLICDEDLVADFDPDLISVVLNTGFYNAVRAGAQQIEFGAQLTADGHWLEIRIEDDGPGFPPALLPPNRFDQPISDSDSTGLGLHLAQTLLYRYQLQQRHAYLEAASSEHLAGAALVIRIPQ